jgi:hypothetical protein
MCVECQGEYIPNGEVVYFRLSYFSLSIALLLSFLLNCLELNHFSGREAPFYSVLFPVRTTLF